MTKKSKLSEVFFYGLFMDQALLKTKGVIARTFRPASAKGYELRIGRRATLVPAKSQVVFGMLAQITDEELKVLYSDPSVAEYRPGPVVVELQGGGQVRAVCFNLESAPKPDERNPEYAAKLRKLAKQLRFPPEYVASIQ